MFTKVFNNILILQSTHHLSLLVSGSFLEFHLYTLFPLITRLSSLSITILQSLSLLRCYYTHTCVSCHKTSFCATCILHAHCSENHLIMEEEIIMNWHFAKWLTHPHKITLTHTHTFAPVLSSLSKL